jgi:hypothetical protein
MTKPRSSRGASLAWSMSPRMFGVQIQENQGSGNGSGHHAKRTEIINRHNIAIVRIVRKSSNVGLFHRLTAALQNLHPRFKSGRRLQILLKDFDDSIRRPSSKFAKGSGKGSGFVVSCGRAALSSSRSAPSLVAMASATVGGSGEPAVARVNRHIPQVRRSPRPWSPCRKGWDRASRGLTAEPQQTVTPTDCRRYRRERRRLQEIARARAPTGSRWRSGRPRAMRMPISALRCPPSNRQIKSPFHQTKSGQILISRTRCAGLPFGRRTTSPTRHQAASKTAVSPIQHGILPNAQPSRFLPVAVPARSAEEDGRRLRPEDRQESFRRVRGLRFFCHGGTSPGMARQGAL